MQPLGNGRRGRPDVSVLIPYFDAADTLGLQLEALAHQRDAPAFEVVVVDNRSSDDLAAVLSQWERVLDLRAVPATQAQGPACARNVGISQARCELLVLCDADDCAGPDFVRSAWEALQVCDFVTGSVIPFDAREFAQGREHLWERLAERAPGELQRQGVDPAYPIMMGGACAMRRSAVVALGGFDQAFWPGVEDNDFALRVVRAGHDIAHHPAMTLAERRRNTPAGAFRRSYDGGLMHMKLCAAYGLWPVSPHLRRPLWWVDLLKLPASAIRLELSRPSADERRALASRAGLRLGQLRGAVRYQWLKRPVARQLGVGLATEDFAR